MNGQVDIAPRQELSPTLRRLQRAGSILLVLRLVPTASRAHRTPYARRNRMRPSWFMRLPCAEGVRHEDITVPGRGGSLRVRIYRRQGAAAAAPGVLYLHGGAFLSGGLEAAHWICTQLAAATGALVVSVDYRLAPEHKYPAAVDDCYDALTWMVANASGLGVDPARVAVAGDSAGGNLAAVLALKARDQAGPRLRAQVLVYPFLDGSLTSESLRQNAVRGMDRREGQAMLRHYLPPGHDPLDPYVSPVHAPDLRGLPPAIVVAAEHDILRDDALRFAELLDDAGVTVHARCWPGLPHGFLSFPRLCPEASTALAEICTQLAGLLGEEGSCTAA